MVASRLVLLHYRLSDGWLASRHTLLNRLSGLLLVRDKHTFGVWTELLPNH